VADADRRGAGVVLLTLPAFLPSVISFFFYSKLGRGGPSPSPRSATGGNANAKITTEVMWYSQPNKQLMLKQKCQPWVMQSSPETDT